MKASQDKEAALQAMKQRCDQLEDDLVQLRNENIELFRRLRVLRVNANSSNSNNNYSHIDQINQDGPSPSSISDRVHNHSSSSSSGDGGGLWNAIRSRRFTFTGGGMASGSSGGLSSSLEGRTSDPLDDKYMGLYEQDISPFRIQQLDKQLVRSNNCE